MELVSLMHKRTAMAAVVNSVRSGMRLKGPAILEVFEKETASFSEPSIFC